MSASISIYIAAYIVCAHTHTCYTTTTRRFNARTCTNIFIAGAAHDRSIYADGSRSSTSVQTPQTMCARVFARKYRERHA